MLHGVVSYKGFISPLKDFSFSAVMILLLRGKWRLVELLCS